MPNQTCLPATLAGRCANGNERDHGRVVHAHPNVEGLERNAYVCGAAICGVKPGRRSAGWSHWNGLAVTCPRCLKKMEKTS